MCNNKIFSMSFRKFGQHKTNLFQEQKLCDGSCITTEHTIFQGRVGINTNVKGRVPEINQGSTEEVKVCTTAR